MAHVDEEAGGESILPNWYALTAPDWIPEME